MSLSCHFRPTLRLIFVLSVVIGPLLGCGKTDPIRSMPSGGKLVVSLRGEPTSFDLLVAARTPEQRVTVLTQAPLVRVNPVTNEIEPRLATSWTASPDQLTWTLRLREGVVFSDGAPFTAEDVAFTFDALNDPKLASPVASALLVAGKPLGVHVIDAHTVAVKFPSPFGPTLRILDGLPMLPKHKLGGALAAGTLRDAWGPSTAVSEVVGLGPFVLTENTPGQAMRFVRNPHYWAVDDRGHRLPYLDEVDVEIVPDQNAETVRLGAGDLDVTNDFIRPEDIAPLRDLAGKGRVTLVEAGVGLDPSALWFNLSSESRVAKDRPWLQREELRHAISLAVDRQAIVDSVYLGLGVPIAGPVTPGYGTWYADAAPVPVRDLARARTLLASAGLSARDASGMLQDATGRPAHFSILTQKGKTERERTGSLLAAQLKAIGLDVDVVLLDPNALLAHLYADDYDAIYFGSVTPSVDPASNLQFWLSSGSFHVWNLHEAQGPATAWESQIDGLMAKQAAMLDEGERHRLFASAQQLFAEHMPALYFVAPKVTIAVSRRLQGVEASIIQPSVLWNIDRLAVGARTAGQ
jgi:peptide/nickel transport system substrate-binding protein